MTPDQFSRLPRYAQVEITDLQRKVGSLKSALVKATSSPADRPRTNVQFPEMGEVGIDWINSNYTEARFPLSDDPQTREWIQFTRTVSLIEKQPLVEVYASHSLIMRPSSSNFMYLGLNKNW
jgi:hypothetical protein